jgi:hypothetical protein
MATVKLLDLARPGIAGLSLPASSVVRCLHPATIRWVTSSGIHSIVECDSRGLAHPAPTTPP